MSALAAFSTATLARSAARLDAGRLAGRLGHRCRAVEQDKPRPPLLFLRADPGAGVEQQGGEAGGGEQAQCEQAAAGAGRKAAGAAPRQPADEARRDQQQRDQDGKWKRGIHAASAERVLSEETRPSTTTSARAAASSHGHSGRP